MSGDRSLPGRRGWPREVEARTPRRRSAPRARLACAVLALGLGLAVAGPGGAELTDAEHTIGVDFDDIGPLRIREPFVLGAGFLAFEPEGAEMLGPGGWQVDLVHSVTNNWVSSRAVELDLEERERRAPLTLAELRAIPADDGDDGVFYADGEVARTSIALRRGLGRSFQVALLVPVLDSDGGFMDSNIEGFHEDLGFGQAGRLGAPRNDYSVYFRSDGAELYHRRAPGAGVGDVAVSLKWRLPAGGGAWHYAVEGVLKAPTGDEEHLYGSGNADVGVQFLATRYGSRGVLHLSGGVLLLGPHDVLGLDEQAIFAGLVAYEHRMGRSWTVVLQISATESPFQDVELDELSPVAFLGDLGVKKGWNERVVTFFAITENMVHFGNSADLGAHFGLTFTW